jgi:diadenosine tetraphosphate (Ap4A) HIT family hydrolase
MPTDDCSLCKLDPESPLWADKSCLVIHAEVPGIHTICRVIWRDHVREMTDLQRKEQHHLWDVVCGVEETLRRLLSPDKMNVASLGNVVPHLHWHVIPRFLDDPFFPDSIWSPPKRLGKQREWPDRKVLRTALAVQLGPAS